MKIIVDSFKDLILIDYYLYHILTNNLKNFPNLINFHY